MVCGSRQCLAIDQDGMFGSAGGNAGAQAE